MDTTKAVTHLSLCSGYGGIDLGLRRCIANLRTVAYAEIEAFACELLLARMEGGQLDAAPIWTDLKRFPWRKFHGCVDILSGGYPCQPFSAAGKRLGADDPRHLWPFIAAGIAAMRPRLCFFENVEGHISLGLEQVLRDLQGLGYRCTFGIFSASEVGAPHQRKRIFILAHCASTGLEGLRAYTGQSNNSEFGDSCSRLYPSRPGQPQFAWEPPRVVADAQRVRRSETRGNAGGVGKTECAEEGTESKFGDAASAFNGGSSVVGDARVQESRWLPSGSGRGEVPEAGQSSRAMGDADCGRLERTGAEPGRTEDAIRRDGESARRQTEPALGGDADGASGGMDYAKLCISGDSRVDELRLLGNGVVPATAERAFNVLASRLCQNTR